MMACGFNRLSTSKLQVIQIGRSSRNDRFGSTALHFAVYVRRYYFLPCLLLTIFDTPPVTLGQKSCTVRYLVENSTQCKYSKQEWLFCSNFACGMKMWPKSRDICREAELTWIDNLKTTKWMLHVQQDLLWSKIIIKLLKSSREQWVDSSALRGKTRRHGDCGVIVGVWCKAFNQERSGKRRLVSTFSFA